MSDTKAIEKLLALRFMSNEAWRTKATGGMGTGTPPTPSMRVPGDAEYALKHIIEGDLAACSILLRLACPDLGEVKRIEREGAHYSTWYTDKGSVQVGTHWCDVERDGIKLSLSENVLIPWSEIR